MKKNGKFLNSFSYEEQQNEKTILFYLILIKLPTPHQNEMKILEIIHNMKFAVFHKYTKITKAVRMRLRLMVVRWGSGGFYNIPKTYSLCCMWV